MSRKLYLFAMLCICFCYTGRVSAQCPSGRYLNEIFTAYSVDSVTYSSVYNLKMDIYQPSGDALAARPLIILAHGGSFIGGNRTDDSTVDKLCQNFAMRGYVTASIDYRLGGLTTMLDSATAVDEVIKAISDGKAAIRYFVKDRATTNTYRIDTNNIYVGGNSAGAVLYMHVGYLTSLSECNTSIQGAMAANGGFDGNSGNAGYSTRCRAVINLAGALNTPSFVNAYDVPSVNCQGDLDNTVPYTCAHALAGIAPVTLCGLGSLEPVYVSTGIYHWSHVFPGDAHVPWDSDPAKFFTVDSLVTQFLYTMVCQGAAEVNVVNTAAEVAVFPNPATEVVNIRSAVAVNNVTVLDQTGRAVMICDGINKGDYELNTSRLAPGVYFIKVRFSDQNTSPVVKQLVIE